MREEPSRSAASPAVAEEDLVDGAVAGDEAAFAALYDRHVDRVYRHVYYRVGNRADAEDITQQVFLQAWRAIGRYRRGGAPFLAWLLTIAHNSVISFYRRAKPARYLDLDVPATAPWSDPETAAFAEHDRQMVRRAITKLKPDQQHVITMRFLEHFDYATVAAVLGKGEGNIRVIQHRALQELRRLLAAEEQR